MQQNSIAMSNLCKHAVGIYTETPLENESLDSFPVPNIPSSIVNQYCHKVSFYSLNHHYRGIGMNNKSGGCQFYNGQFTTTPLTVGPKGITIIKAGRKKRSASCCLFLHFIDFLQYESHTLNQVRQEDIVILNDVTNICLLIKTVREYQTVRYTFYESAIGEIVRKTIQDIYPDKKEIQD